MNLNDIKRNATISLGYGMIESIAIMSRNPRLRALSLKIKILIVECHEFERLNKISDPEYDNKCAELQRAIYDFEKIMMMLPQELLVKIKQKFKLIKH
jgi:hypothetical protein